MKNGAKISILKIGSINRYRDFIILGSTEKAYELKVCYSNEDNVTGRLWISKKMLLEVEGKINTFTVAKWGERFLNRQSEYLLSK